MGCWRYVFKGVPSLLAQRGLATDSNILIIYRHATLESIGALAVEKLKGIFKDSTVSSDIKDYMISVLARSYTGYNVVNRIIFTEV